MKRMYNKPIVLSVDTIVPDQAIAGCSKPPAGATAQFMGWGIEGDRSWQNHVWGILYDTYDAAIAARDADQNRQGAAIIGVYYVRKNNEELVYEDFAPYNGVDHDINYSLTHSTSCGCNLSQTDNAANVQIQWNGDLAGRFQS